ncbi:hypothetical protein [Psychrobacter sp. I-STPA10]|uniref:hypothetical protein n=1 Tax=Psychrobacter sp. I-STPA10 TaxID=2585769 RepID=UPI001E466B91|nr:hypothetical protein [Psychrobacter sp. I-STPA10]
MVSALWGLWVLYRYPYRPKVGVTCHCYDILSRKVGWSSAKYYYYIDGQFSFTWHDKQITQQGTGFEPSFYQFLSEAEAEKRFENWQKRGCIGFVDTCKQKVILDIPINKKEQQIQCLKDIIFAVAVLVSVYTGSILA